MGGIEDLAQRVAKILVDDGRLLKTKQLVGYGEVAVDIST